MASLGQELKRERELRGISLKEIAGSTKINIKFLQALENDELEILPGEFFIKGILSAYAKCLGLEKEYVLNKYYEDSLLKELDSESEHQTKKSSSNVFPRKLNFFSLVFISVLLFLIFLSFYFISRPRKSAEASQETQIAVPFQEKEPIPPPKELPQIKEASELGLKISFLYDTWIQVYADGELVLDGLKKEGEQASVRAGDELILHLGNAGGISYSLNGRTGKPLGNLGAVRKNIKINFDNFNEFLVQKKQEEIKE
jgi:cytoskeleton protein RodZ